MLELDGAEQSQAIPELQNSGLHLTATMIHFPGEDYTTIEHIPRTGGYLSNETYAARKELTTRASHLTKSLRVKYLTTHIGFVPGKTGDEYMPMLIKIREIC